MFLRIALLALALVTIHSNAGRAFGADSPAPLSMAQKTAMKVVERNRSLVVDTNHELWKFAEVGLQEERSSELLQARLKEAGFQVKSGVAEIPTAFVASYGRGKPVIGILAEYDALPGMSQRVSPIREPLQEGAAGHACGHSGLGSGALGAALAVKAAMETHKLKGTIRLYGTPAEETVIGKVYMLLEGQFRDLDVCLHWHPSTHTETWNGSSKALISSKFTFDGVSAHAAGNPESGRSALDAVELMNIGVNFMREHVREDARIHYVITDGGGAPNVVPPKATVWYFVRADSHEDVERYYARINRVAQGAALMTDTKLSVKIDTDCHELIPNTPLAEMMHGNLLRVPQPRFTPQEEAFARRLQQPLVEQFGSQFPVAIDTKIRTLSESARPSKGSTDVGDISWFVPTCGIRTTCFAAESPGHSWQNVACIGSSIGDKGTVQAAAVLAISAVELLEDPQVVRAARTDFESRMKGRNYTTQIPKGQKAPVKIR